MYCRIEPSQEFKASPASELTTEVPLADFAGQTGARVTVLARAPMRLRVPAVVGPHASGYQIQRPHGMPWRANEFPTFVDHPAMTISRLADVCVVPGGIALSIDHGRFLSESFGAYWEPQPHLGIGLNDRGGFHLKEGRDITRRLPGVYFYCDSQHIGHFGHFLLDNVTRLWGYLFCRDYLGMRDVRILTRPLLHEVRRTMDALGIDEDHVVDLTEPVICEDLIIATKSLQIQDYVTPLAAPLFGRIRDGLKGDRVFPQRIYISRRTSSLRPLLNEVEVERVFERRGFTVMLPSDFGSFDNQVSAFAQVEYLAGPSGTNMFCTAFQRSLVKSFIMSSPSLIHYAEAFMHEGHDSRLTIYVGDIDESDSRCNSKHVNSPWMIADLSRFEEAVDAWLAHG